MSSPDVSDTEDNMTYETTYPLNVATEVPKTGGKLFKTVLEEGTGAVPPRNSKVTVSYKGTLESDGSTFDSSDSFDFTIGKGQVIKGWDQGVATMKKGERAILRCLPEYAYGASGSPPRIPANATLNFEVRVIDWTKSDDISADKDKSIMKSTHVEGRGYDRAEYESVVTADVVVYLGGGADAAEDAQKTEVARKTAWEITVGETPLPVGLETALSNMKEGESADITVAARIVTSNDADFGIVAGSTVTYSVTLHKLVKVKTWSYAGAEKVAEGAKRKEQGNAYFKAGNWAAAEKKYRRCLEFVESDYGFSDEEKAEATKVKVAALSNLAQVLLNVKRYADAVTECNKVLTTDGSNLKALFRRGRALGLLDDWEAAKQDLSHVLEMDPGNADAARELEDVKRKIRDFDRAQKAKFSNLFAKLSAMEEKEAKTKSVPTIHAETENDAQPPGLETAAAAEEP